MKNNKPYSGYLDRRDSADYIGHSIYTLEDWGRKGQMRNVRYEIKGKNAYYKISDLDEYEKSKQTF